MFSTNTLLYSAAVLFAGIASAVPTCGSEVRVITVRGTNEILGQSCLKNEFGAILEQGVNAELQGTPYPAILDYSNNNVYVGSVTQGVYSLQSIIKGAVEQCPQQKLVLLGYSQGANVVMDAICGGVVAGNQAISSQYADSISAVAVFGDPTHNAGQNFVRGGGNGNGNIPRYNNMDCAPFTDRLVSYCHPGDPVCDDGNDISQHLSYMTVDTGDAAYFIKSKL